MSSVSNSDGPQTKPRKWTPVTELLHNTGKTWETIGKSSEHGDFTTTNGDLMESITGWWFEPL